MEVKKFLERRTKGPGRNRPVVRCVAGFFNVVILLFTFSSEAAAQEALRPSAVAWRTASAFPRSGLIAR